MDDGPARNKFILREEVPSFQKYWVPTGEINGHTEIVVEETTITVPLRRQELVVERKHLDPDAVGAESNTETTRYLLREERIEYQVKPFDIEAVRIDKRQAEDLQTVEVSLMKEVLSVKKAKGLFSRPGGGSCHY